jgi:hypothetical protein
MFCPQCKAEYFRVEMQEDGGRKLFVLPEDEACAREIIREINEDVSPE